MIYFVLAALLLFTPLQAFALPIDTKAPALAKLYSQNNGESLWLDGDKPTACALALIKTIEQSADDGVNPVRYASLLTIVRDTMSGGDKAASFDVALSTLALRYMSDVRAKESPEKAASRLLLGAREKNGNWGALLPPQNFIYASLKKALAQYRALQAKDGGWTTLPKYGTLQLGDQGGQIALLKAQLIAQDAMHEDLRAGDVFDDTITRALAVFQENHGIKVTGRLDKETIKQLNIPIDQRIMQILTALERARSFGDGFEERFILVNIPGFWLHAYDRNKLLVSMDIIVGQNARKTPIFNAPLTGIIFNPSWHVPISIAVRDKLSKLRRNPGEFSAKGYTVYDSNGTRHDPRDINWNAVSAGNFPYRLVQAPGRGNALGKLRFTITNPYGVYLHGTSQPELFDKSLRNLSSGCIRLRDPVALAAFVLQDTNGWAKERINEETAGNRTKNLNLKIPMPVHITYLTAWVDVQGAVHFASDIYGKNKKH